MRLVHRVSWVVVLLLWAKTWAFAQPAAAPEPEPGIPIHSEAVKKACGACHAADATGCHDPDLLPADDARGLAGDDQAHGHAQRRAPRAGPGAGGRCATSPTSWAWRPRRCGRRAFEVERRLIEFSYRRQGHGARPARLCHSIGRRHAAATHERGVGPARGHAPRLLPARGLPGLPLPWPPPRRSPGPTASRPTAGTRGQGSRPLEGGLSAAHPRVVRLVGQPAALRAWRVAGPFARPRAGPRPRVRRGRRSRPRREPTTSSPPRPLRPRRAAGRSRRAARAGRRLHGLPVARPVERGAEKDERCAR